MNLKNAVLTFTFILEILFSHCSVATHDNKDANLKTVNNTPRISYETLTDIGKNFVEFIKTTGQSEAPVTHKQLEIFASQCKKVVNGKVLFISPTAYPDQIAGARKAIGKWSVQTLWETASPNDRAYTVGFKWKSEKMPESITVATIFVNEQGKIDEIQEVYNLYDQQKLDIQ